MAQTPEGKVKTAVRKMLLKHGIYYFMPPGMGLGRSGIPDIIGCKNGKFIAIECKAGKGKTTALQERELLAICNAGGFTFVVNETCLDELEERLLTWIS
jgi:Holliday junction resolvase